MIRHDANRSIATLFALFAFGATHAAHTPTAAAEEVAASADETTDFGLGARIGGYGFRDEHDGRVTWEDCRMDGIGVFGTIDFTEHFFGEAGLDLYYATGPTQVAGMDRLSFHNQYALGARIFPEFFVTPYIQIGGGPEITSIEVGESSKTMVTGTGFMGVGGEVNLGDLKLGMHIRGLMMAHPIHDHAEDGSYHLHLEPGESDASTETPPEVETDWEMAGQVHFFMRHAF